MPVISVQVGKCDANIWWNTFCDVVGTMANTDTFKVRLHVASPSSVSVSRHHQIVNIVSMEMDCLTGKMGTELIPSVKQSVPLESMLTI